MKLAIISDIHGNIQALEAVLEEIKRQGHERILCMGDLVGYGPNPNEVIARIRQLAIPTIMGNYDEAVGFLLPSCGCHIGDNQAKYLSTNSLQWSAWQTTKENRAYLRSLPEEMELTIQGHVIRMTHASLESINEYVYEKDIARLSELLASIQEEIYIYGHTHYPYIKQMENHWVINGGSVGRPKDGDNRANFITLFIEEDKICGRIERVTYDYEKTARAIEESDLDNWFADYIRLGGERKDMNEQVLSSNPCCCNND